jgi:uncharacterized membrane protein YraQ (UPF0718 family)
MPVEFLQRWGWVRSKIKKFWPYILIGFAIAALIYFLSTT